MRTVLLFLWRSQPRMGPRSLIVPQRRGCTSRDAAMTNESYTTPCLMMQHISNRYSIALCRSGYCRLEPLQCSYTCGLIWMTTFFVHQVLLTFEMSQSLQDQDPWTIPLAPPPSGIVSSFHKQSSLMGLSVGITVVVFALMVATLSLRFWTKYKGQEKWHLDDCALSTDSSSLTRSPT